MDDHSIKVNVFVKFDSMILEYGGPYLHIDKEWKLGNSFLDEYNVSKEDHLVHSSSLTHI